MQLSVLRQLRPRLAPQWWGWPVVWRILLALVVLANLSIIAWAFLGGPNPWRDGDAYLNAALRIRAGLPLYPALADYQTATVYRYAPWFAYAWVPVSYLPRTAVISAWQVAMLACSALALMPAWHAGWTGRVIAVAVSPLLVMASVWGNVQPAIVALLVYTIRGRAGPVAIAAAASLKLVPLLFVATYVARRQWGAALTAIGLTALLWAPVVIVGVDHYPADVGSTTSIWAFSPALWAAVAVVLVVIAYLLGRRPEGWYASSLLVALGTPRFIAYDWTFLLVGAASNHDGDAGRPRRPALPDAALPTER